MEINKKIAEELKINLWQADAAVKLLDEDNTVPFIARYRKEVTGKLTDDTLRDLEKLLTKYRNLEKRREEILTSIEEQDKLTEELKELILNASTLSALEDLYLPYKKKKRTKALIAKEKGLEPLAEKIRAQNSLTEPIDFAEEFINPEKGVLTAEDALSGAMDIIAEKISDSAEIRGDIRRLMQNEALICSVGDKEKKDAYFDYADFSESVKKIAPHRVLALNRGENEKALKISIKTDMDKALFLIEKRVITAKNNPSGRIVLKAAEDSLKRLIYPSLENELRNLLTENAENQAIKVFGLNLKPLLMQPPLKAKAVMGFDPAYRTGCKIAVVDSLGKVLDTTVVYPTPPQNKKEEAAEKLSELIKKYNIDVISIGNGTASKESEIFVSELIKGTNVKYMVVSEAGASVYSASKLAAEEFPQFDVSLRSAVSIARRLIDPLAELVKIDPKSIGVGLYQHDMPPKRLDETLKGVVESCVNSVGVDLNTASFSLLSYVSGIGEKLAKSIVSYREENGAFKNRKELKKVPKLGEKAFTQCAGFLRIANGTEPLDNTAVHPESYAAAEKLLKLINCNNLKDLSEENTEEQNSDIKKTITKAAELDKINTEETAKALNIGKITLEDIITELKKPGRDPRDELPKPMLRSDLMDLNNLKPGMILKGTVRNVVDFGAFVDIGVHEDGLVHISRICNKFIKHPSEVLSVGDIVNVKVLEIDAKRNRISLTMRDID